MFNMLPSYIKIEPDNPKKFPLILQKFLYENSFYFLYEYFELKKKLNLFLYDLNNKFGTQNRYTSMFILFFNYIFSFCICILDLILYKM